MNLLLNSIISNSFAIDLIGLLGLGILALAAWRMVRTSSTWGGAMIGYGALALFVARIFIVMRPHFLTFEFQAAIGPIGISLAEGLPPILLTFGLAGIVWGLWGHEKWLSEKA